MAELKRKEEQLTTADLAGRNEGRIRKAEDRANPERANAENRAEMDKRSAESRMNEERGGPTLVRHEGRGETKVERNMDRAQQPGTPQPANMAVNSAPLFFETDVNDLRGRWSNVQSDFVDEPRRAVEHADKLVAAVMQRLAEGFATERSNLEKQWARGDNDPRRTCVLRCSATAASLTVC
jgi:hypothetical protein